MQRDHLTSLAWGVLAVCLGVILWRTWARAAGPQARLVDGADMAWAAAEVAASFLILAALSLAVWRTGGGARVSWRRAGDGRFLRLVAAALGGTLAVGASGAVSALGDGGAGPDRELEVIHPLAAVVVSFVLLRLANAVRRRRKRPGGPPGGQAAATAAVRWANRLHLLVFIQLALGTLNTVLVGQVWIDLAHLLAGDLVWIAAVLTAAASLPAVRGPARRVR